MIYYEWHDFIISGRTQNRHTHQRHSRGRSVEKDAAAADGGVALRRAAPANTTHTHTRINTTTLSTAPTTVRARERE